MTASPPDPSSGPPCWKKDVSFPCARKGVRCFGLKSAGGGGELMGLLLCSGAGCLSPDFFLRSVSLPDSVPGSGFSAFSSAVSGRADTGNGMGEGGR